MWAGPVRVHPADMIEPIAAAQGAPGGDADGGGVLAACVLLFLDHHDCDGDDLVELITAFGLAHRGAALPATLRALHRQALISIDRQPIVDDEPSPRVYRLTDRGRRWLHERADTLGEPARLVTRFLQRYSASATTAVGADTADRSGHSNQPGL